MTRLHAMKVVVLAVLLALSLAASAGTAWAWTPPVAGHGYPKPPIEPFGISWDD